MAYKYTSPKDVLPDKTYIINGVTTKDYLITKHNPNKSMLPLPPKRTSKQKIIGVTIHNTDDLAKVDDDGRNYIAATINGNMNDVYVHYYVDDLYAWHCMPDDRISWSCSDGAAGMGNSQTICIEVIMSGTDGVENAKAKDNAARLAAQLLYDNKLTIQNLYTHTYWINKVNKVSGSPEQLCCIPPKGRKKCPYYIIPKWNEFVALVNQYLQALQPKEEVYRVRKAAADAATQIGAYRNLTSAKDLADYNKGYKVYNSKNKLIYAPKTYYIHGKIKVKRTPLYNSPNTNDTPIAFFDDAMIVSIYDGVIKKDSKGNAWVKIKYPTSTGYAWIMKNTVTPVK